MLKPFCALFSCNSIPRSGCSALHGVNSNFFFLDLNNATPENSNDPENVCSSKYYDIEEMHNIELPHKNKSLSLLHINACSLNKNSDDLQHLLNCTKKIDIKAISETRITKQVYSLNNLNRNNYSFEFTPTETSAGGRGTLPFFTLLIIYHINVVMT